MNYQQKSKTQAQRSPSVMWLSSTRGTWDSISCTFLETTQFDLYRACKFSISHDSTHINTCCAHLHTSIPATKCCSAAEAVSFAVEREKNATANSCGIRIWLCQEKLDAVKHILLMCLQGFRRVGAAPACCRHRLRLKLTSVSSNGVKESWRSAR